MSVWAGHSCPSPLALALDLGVASVGRTLLSDTFDFGVGVALAVDLEVARVGRTLLSDAFDFAVGVALAVALALDLGVFLALDFAWDLSCKSSPA
jgi:hypothetical protein